MIPKQDRQGVRHARDIEQKYDLNADYSAIEKIATDAKQTASIAKRTAGEAAESAKETAESLNSLTEQHNALSETVSENAEAIAESIEKLDSRVDTLEESGTGGGTVFTTDETLSLNDGVLSVNRATSVEQDNTLPITSAAVYTEIGNIDALLQTI